MAEKILLHACCAVCMAYPIELLKNIEKDYEPVVFFYNPNIYPAEEYERRKNELVNYCKKMGYEYIIDEYDVKNWQEFVKGYEQEPEKGKRCDRCFYFRLKKSAQKAKELGIKYFTTTLTVSPHKISQNVFASGQKAAKECDVEFVEQDFKKQNGFLNTMKLAKENNFYRQQYCGCEYSIRKESRQPTPTQRKL